MVPGFRLIPSLARLWGIRYGADPRRILVSALARQHLVYAKEILDGYVEHPDAERWTAEETVVSNTREAALDAVIVTLRVQVLDHRLLPGGNSNMREQPEKHLLVRQGCVWIVDGGYALAAAYAPDPLHSALFHADFLQGKIPADYCFPVAVGKEWGRVATTSPAEELVWRVNRMNGDGYGPPGERTFHMAKDPAIGFKTINGMAETAASKPAFRESMRTRRCLIPSDGFFEWKKSSPKEEQPYNFGMVDDSIFAFAGLWDRWKDRDGKQILSCTILTTKPNALVSDVHDRMPAILRPEDYDPWLDPGITDPTRIADLLAPFDARLMKKYPVSMRVNSVKNDDPERAKEIKLVAEPQSGLFA